MKFDTRAHETKMQKTLEVLERDFDSIRVGRASVRVLDQITVPYYGVPTAIEGVATVKSPDPRTLIIQPWESSMLKEIEKAIAAVNSPIVKKAVVASDLGIMPQNDGKVIRLPFPPLTEEHRRDLTKKASKLGEEAKVAVRNVRREANDEIKKQKKDGILTEDDQRTAEKAVQDLTDRYCKLVDEKVAKKEKEIMEL